MGDKNIVLYGCAWETEKFIKKHPDLNIELCMDDTLYGGSFLEWYIYSPMECVRSLKGKLVLVFTRNPARYNKIKAFLKDYGLIEFEDFIPYYLYGKRIALIWGNCHAGQVKSYLLNSKEFESEYAFYEMTDIWRMKESEIDPNIFRQCELFVSQDIQKENSLGYVFSSENIESMLPKECTSLKFPNLFGLPKFLYPDLEVKNCFSRKGGGIKWYRDRFLDALISDSYSYENICLAVDSRVFDYDLLEKGKNDFFNKLRKRELNCNIHISDYLQEHFTETKLFLDVEHPSKYVICEIANRILDRLLMKRLNADTYLFSTYGHEVVMYPGIKEYFGFTWENGDIKKDNPSEKLRNVYMDINEYVKEYIQIYGCKVTSPISYKACILQNSSPTWLNLVETNGIAGTVGMSTAICGICIDGINELDIRYKLKFSDLQWSEEKKRGEECIYTGKGYVTGFWLSHHTSKYIVTYQGHFQRIGWSQWYSSGESCSHDKYWLEAIRIKVVKRSDLMNHDCCK